MNYLELDPCLFLGDKIVCIIYVYDLLFLGNDANDISAFAAKLCALGVNLEEEDDAAGFLGVTMHRNQDGSMELKQTGLIDWILEALGLDSKLFTICLVAVCMCSST